MTYEELKSQIQAINIAYEKQFRIFNTGQSIDIRDANGCYAIISNRTPYSLYVSDTNFERLLEDNLRYDLLKAAYEFAQTPIESRNLLPKYYISSKLTPDKINRFLFKEFNNIDLLGWGYKDGENTEFTKEEIDYICDKFNTDLKDFEIIEVKD